jgi:anthranilate synthase component 1
MFFGGLFAYDLVAGFEDSPPLKATPPARTTASIWRKPCWLSTIRPKYPHSGEPVHPAEKNSVWTAPAQLRQQLNEPPRRCR